MLKSINRNGILLAVFAIICTGAIAIINLITKPMIAEQQQKALLKIVDKIIPKDSYDNDLFASCFRVRNDHLLGKNQQQRVFLAKKQGENVALVIEASTFNGYSGEIKLAIAILNNGTIAGVRVLKQKETPGLGDKILASKTNWILAFAGKSYQQTHSNNWNVKKDGGDFDAFTGATITPRAVTFAIRDALIYFKKHKTFLFNHPATCEVN
ncbi:MAG: electron transport complex subunit RsxG [Psychromonas sp.]|nr:electron transport complex subunit RsxG [Psychromonas sp.]